MAKTRRSSKSPSRSAGAVPPSAKSKLSAPGSAPGSPDPETPTPDAPDAKSGAGKHLVIVESPTKAKTINKYLGSGYIVMASVGHVRDLPARAPKGSKRAEHPVPGVDLKHDFKPTYEILPEKQKTVTELRKVAKKASDVWFATDLDREGEAIAWHLAQALNLDPTQSKRVVFNAITKSEIQHAFASPRPIDENRVNAQQARRILDRIVGYQVSPLLWKKVAGGLSAGRVQSVAVRVVVEREREIEAFIPEEYWKITGAFATDLAKAPALAKQWHEWLASAAADEPRTIKERIAWLSDHGCIRAELVEAAGKPFHAKTRDDALAVAQSLGFEAQETTEWRDPKGRGPAAFLVKFVGKIPGASSPKFSIASITTKRVTSRPSAPFITSTLQQAGSTRLGFPLQRTMRIAQQLYEGIDLKGARGQTGLITYMRTDSTHLSGEALTMARDYIGKMFGPKYLPEKPNFFTSSNKAAQEAHEAIRPTDVSITPDSIRSALSDEQFKLYRIIWERFVSCQMTHAEWDSTTVLIEAKRDTPIATFRATGRTLVFDGFYKVSGVPNAGEDAILPPLKEQQEVAPLQVDPTQHFTSPPPRYTEASLQKKLEEEGIGRPSTYAAIISTIQDRKYVQPLNPRDRRLYATDLGKVVTDKLIEGFPKLMDVGYTREMETELDKIEDEHHDWIQMLREFYGPFKKSLEAAHEDMTHAKAEMEPAPYSCPDCKAPTVYRFGKNGRFLSCSRYPDCKYAAPIDREGNPMQAEMSDISCPLCNSGMTRRVGRFGPFLGCANYPTCKGILKIDPKKGTLVTPKPPPLLTELKCPKCESPLNLRRSSRGPWLSCSAFPKCRGRLGWSAVPEDQQTSLEKALAAHEKANPSPVVRTRDGRVVTDGYQVQILGGDSGSSDGAAEATADAAVSDTSDDASA